MFNHFKQLDCSFHMFLDKNEKHVFSPQLRPEIPVLSQLQSNLWNDHPIEMCFKTSKIIKHLHVDLGWNMLKHIVFPIVNAFPMVSHAFPILSLVCHAFPLVFLWFSYAFPMVFLYGSYGFPMVWTSRACALDQANTWDKSSRWSSHWATWAIGVKPPEDVNILWLINHINHILTTYQPYYVVIYVDS